MVQRTTSRRSLVKGLAWATPTAVVVMAAPAYAASQDPDSTASFVGDLGVGDGCDGAVVRYMLERGTSEGVGGLSERLRILASMQGVGVSYTGDEAPTVSDLSITMYLNTRADIFGEWPAELNASIMQDSFYDETTGEEVTVDGEWSNMVRQDDVTMNGETFAVYQATYSGGFFSADGMMNPAQADWEFVADPSDDADRVAQAQSPVPVGEEDAVDVYLRNQGAVVISGTINGAQASTPPSLGSALAEQGASLWMARHTEEIECRWIPSKPDLPDVEIPCPGDPDAPDPYPYPNKDYGSLEASSRNSCEPMGAEYRPPRG